MGILQFDSKELYYVIVGCGFSAITNHSILQQQALRLGKLTVLHIGEPDPWAGYYSMPMGQWPALLTLPGYQSKLNNVTGSVCLDSNEFAKANQDEWNLIAAARPFTHLTGSVLSIRKISAPADEYEIILDDPTSTVVRAANIDVCAGPGQARRPPSNVSINKILRNEFDTNSSSSAWPRLVSGEKYLSQSKWTTVINGSVCVIGGGPTAAWCVERAQSTGNQVFWLSNGPLNSAFVSSRRNDGLLGGIIERELFQGEYVIKGVLSPKNPTTIFGEGFEAATLSTLSNQKVRVFFQPLTSVAQRYVSSAGAQRVPAHLDVDQVIYSIGQNTDPNDSQSWAGILKSVLKSGIKKHKHLIKDRYGRAVGLQSEDERIRVLGATALSHPSFQPQLTTTDAELRKFYRTLTDQARVRIGITLSAVTIAEANNLWGANANENINTAALADFKELMKLWDPELRGPETWLEMRGVRIPPLVASEFTDLQRKKTHY